jgi:hypothetical protein
VVIFVYLFRFGILYHETSGNPASGVDFMKPLRPKFTDKTSSVKFGFCGTFSDIESKNLAKMVISISVCSSFVFTSGI